VSSGTIFDDLGMRFKVKTGDGEKNYPVKFRPGGLRSLSAP